MGIVLENCLLTDLDPPRVEAGAIRLDGGRIVERGLHIARATGDDVVDCGGAVILPGLVNGHAHLYSALAVGMPPPPQSPGNFLEILKFVWWRLDRALDATSNELSARIGALDALRCGTTTLIDHHASPSSIDGSLDQIEGGLAAVGLRGVLCYETTDRNGLEGREAGIEENRRYLQECVRRHDGRFAGMVGAHALITLEDETLEELAALAEHFDTGVHIHVAEDPCDEQECQAQHQIFLSDRLASHGLLRAEAVFAHGTHLDPEAIARVNRTGTTIAHCPRSNMNNSVGYTPVATMTCPVMLGTDGIGSDMFAEARAAWFISRHEQAPLTPADIIGMLAASARRASMALGISLGKLEIGAAADVVITDYRPFTPLTAQNLPGHFLFALGAQNVASVITDGKWALRDRKVVACDEPKAHAAAKEAAVRLWQRMAKIE